MLNKVLNVSENLIKWIALILFIFLGGLMLIFRNDISFDVYERSTITHNGGAFYLILLITILLLMALCSILRYIPEKVLFCVLSILYWIGGIFLITHIQMDIRADAGCCYTTALSFLEGEFVEFEKTQYFYKNPHQVGLLLYDYILVNICEDVNFLFFVNLIWIILGNFFVWKTVALLDEENAMVRKITILFSFLFLPRFFYIFFAYGLVSGFECILIATYFIVRAIKKDSKISMVLGVLFLTLACVLKINFIIAGIACILILLYTAIKKKKFKFVVMSICIIIMMFLPMELIKAYLESLVGADLHQGMPNTLYIAMGLQKEEGAWRAAGWYNDFHHNVYFLNDCNVEISNAIAIATIKDRLLFFIHNPMSGLEFFKEKIISMWCEPTYQSVWTGPQVSLGGLTEVEWLAELYSGGDIFMKFGTVMNAVNVIMFVSAAWYILWSILHKDKEFGVWNMFNVLFVIGGFVFHVFWEAKSQYVYTYVVCVLPLAAQGVWVATESLKRVMKRFDKQVETK